MVQMDVRLNGEPLEEFEYLIAHCRKKKVSTTDLKWMCYTGRIGQMTTLPIMGIKRGDRIKVC